MTDKDYFNLLWRQSLPAMLTALAALAAAAALLVMLAACTTTRYMPVEHTVRDTLLRTALRRDSVFLHDSVYVLRYTSGDTVFLVRDRWHTSHTERLLHDTAYVSHTDTLTRTVAVPSRLTRWQRFSTRFTAAVLCLLAAAVLFLLARAARRLFPP